MSSPDKPSGKTPLGQNLPNLDPVFELGKDPEQFLKKAGAAFGAMQVLASSKSPPNTREGVTVYQHPSLQDPRVTAFLKSDTLPDYWERMFILLRDANYPKEKVLFAASALIARLLDKEGKPLSASEVDRFAEVAREALGKVYEPRS